MFGALTLLAALATTPVTYLDARTNHVLVVESGAPGQPIDLTPPPATFCNFANAGVTLGLWLCPSNVMLARPQPWVWVGPPPLVPCSNELRGQQRNGYDCTRDEADGRWRVWVPVQR